MNALMHWPGGIPAHIKQHHEPIPWDLLGEEVKGWQLFLEENLIPRSATTAFQDPNYEITQRRNLVSQWALFSQEIRDSYQARAPLRSHDSWYPKGAYSTIEESMPGEFCNLIVPQPMSNRNRALWTKLRIMLYHISFEKGIFYYDTGPLFGWDGDMAACAPNPADVPLTAERFYRYRFVEPASFGNMAMTRTGTVIYSYSDWRICFVDEEALETGRLFLCDIENNGNVAKVSARVWPIMIGQQYPLFKMNKPLELERVHHSGINLPLNMELPILEILSSFKPWFVGNRETLIRDIERNAPGYLEMEEASNGMVSDYDHANFKNQDGDTMIHML